MKKISPIKKLRLHLKMTMETFAIAIKVTASAICHYESSNRRPKIKTAHRILDLANKNSYPMTLNDIYPRPSSKSKS